MDELKNNLQSTPAYVFDENIIVNNLMVLQELKKNSGCQLLYSIKALPLERVIRLAKQYLEGVSVSSLFEARLAKEVFADSGSIHITTPGLRDDELNEITELCSHISFNSLNQYQRAVSHNNLNSSVGVRVNPRISYATDSRFDPCRSHSKLGVSISEFVSMVDKVEGLHFHTVFSNLNYLPLKQIVDLLISTLGGQLSQLKWINLGGGYLYEQINSHEPFIKIVKQLKIRYDLDVFVEPGKAVVGNAGYLITTVIDCFISDGKKIAVLDASVNHHPEVFEYQQKPDLFEADVKGEKSCILVGSSCLAGDVFGEYPFNKVPKVGDRLVFFNVGAYSLIKANRFNGYNLPDVYVKDRHNNVLLVKQTSYQNYREQWGANQ